MGRAWTQTDDKYIREHAELTNEIIGNAIGRTARSICDRRRDLGVPPQSGWEGIRKPVAMSKYEKVFRIKKMAMEMRVRIDD